VVLVVAVEQLLAELVVLVEMVALLGLKEP